MPPCVRPSEGTPTTGHKPSLVEACSMGKIWKEIKKEGEEERTSLGEFSRERSQCTAASILEWLVAWMAVLAKSSE